MTDSSMGHSSVHFMSVTEERSHLQHARAVEIASHSAEHDEFNPYFDALRIPAAANGFVTVADFAMQFRVGQRRKARTAGRSKKA